MLLKLLGPVWFSSAFVGLITMLACMFAMPSFLSAHKLQTCSHIQPIFLSIYNFNVVLFWASGNAFMLEILTEVYSVASPPLAHSFNFVCSICLTGASSLTLQDLFNMLKQNAHLYFALNHTTEQSLEAIVLNACLVNHQKGFS